MTVTNLAISEFDVSLIPNGSKSRTRIVVGQLPDGKPLSFPVMVVRGARAGKTLLATGAMATNLRELWRFRMCSPS